MIFDLWSQVKKRELFESDLYFLYFKLFTVPWLIVLVFCNKFYTSFSYFCDWNTEGFHRGFISVSAIFMTEILKAFIGALLQHLGKLDPKTTSCKACSKFKPLCLLFFITVLLFHQMIALQKLKNVFCLI